MRSTATLITFFLGICCASAQDSKGAVAYGYPLDTTATWTVGGVLGLMEVKERAYVTVEGMAVASCRRDGCSFDVALPDDRVMKVICRPDSFSVPVGGVSGKRVVMRGSVGYHTMDSDVLRHVVEESGTAQAGSSKATGWHGMLVLEADGVVIFY